MALPREDLSCFCGVQAEKTKREGEDFTGVLEGSEAGVGSEEQVAECLGSGRGSWRRPRAA